MGILLSPAMYSTTLLFIGASLVMGDSALMSGGTQTGPASSTKVKLLCDGDGIAVCERGEYLLNGRLVTLLAWDNATSLNDRWPALDAQVSKFFNLLSIRIVTYKLDGFLHFLSFLYYFINLLISIHFMILHLGLHQGFSNVLGLHHRES